jgi:LysR family hydrogen peroxide-inducible transcriptional activator
MVSVKQLRYFEAVVRFGHFGKAADHCAVTQPALSMQIQELENALGLQLLERRPRGAEATDAGREIGRRASRILSELRDLEDFARQRAEVLTGPLNFGVIPTVAPYVLPALVPLMRERYPMLELRIRETQTAPLVEELLDGSLDLLMLALPLDRAEVETAPLMEDRFLLALPKGRRFHGRAPDLSELMKNDRLLLLEEGHCFRDQALAYCQLRKVEDFDAFGASNLSTLVQMVANGMGITLIPEISVELEATRTPVRLVRFEQPEPKRTLGLAWRAASPRKRDFSEFGTLIVEAASSRTRKDAAPRN